MNGEELLRVLIVIGVITSLIVMVKHLVDSERRRK